MSTQQNKNVVRRFVDDVLNKGNPDVADQLLAPDFVGHYAGAPDVPNREVWKQLATAYFTAFPDLHETIEDMLVEGDKITYRATWTATHKGEFMGLPSTDKRITVTGMRIVRIVDGKIAEQWGVDDALGMMQQLGVVPTPDQVTG